MNIEMSENANREDGSEISGGRERVKITYPLQMTCFCVVSWKKT